MSPNLERDSLPHDKMLKFIRQGGRVIHDSEHIQHDEIANQHEMDTPDDAGFINDFGPEISVTGESFHLGLKRDPEKRQETLKIVEKVTGKPAVDYESFEE